MRQPKSETVIVTMSYGRNPDAVFMMQTNDFRLAPDFFDRPKVIATGEYISKQRKFITVTGDQYRIFSDWSASKIRKYTED